MLTTEEIEQVLEEMRTEISNATLFQNGQVADHPLKVPRKFEQWTAVLIPLYRVMKLKNIYS